MMEHVKNYSLLLQRVATWMKTGGCTLRGHDRATVCALLYSDALAERGFAGVITPSHIHGASCLPRSLVGCTYHARVANEQRPMLTQRSTRAGAKMFVHIFTHKQHPFHYVKGWMAEVSTQQGRAIACIHYNHGASLRAVGSVHGRSSAPCVRGPAQLKSLGWRTRFRLVHLSHVPLLSVLTIPPRVRPFTRPPNARRMQNFFTGGQMPSDDLLLYFQQDLALLDHWVVNGAEYEKTSNAWLEKFDENRETALKVIEATYGKENKTKWVVNWRLFFIACAELFGFDGGNEWAVSHYLFEKPARA